MRVINAMFTKREVNKNEKKKEVNIQSAGPNKIVQWRICFTAKGTEYDHRII